MFNQVISLLKIKSGKNTDYELENEITTREVFCELSSITQKEFYQAQAVGIQPELCFLLSDYLDYQNEECIEFEGTRYKVIRTYKPKNSNSIEIYVSKVVNEGDKYERS